MPAAYAAEDGAAAAAGNEAAAAAGKPEAAPAATDGKRSLLEPGHNKYIPLPENIATYGKEMDDLFMLIFWLTGATFVFTEGLLIYAMLRYRHVQGKKSKYEHGNHKLEIFWTVVPGVILFGLAVYQVGPWRRIKMEGTDDKQAVHIQVLAKQFEWNFRYAGADLKFGTGDDVYEVKKLYIPKGRKVVVWMRSTDVIHSLFLPHLRFKQDVMPGLTVPGWFEATKTTAEGQLARNNPFFNYEIACAELCGPQHGFMRGDVFILEADEFDKFMTAEYEKQKDYDAPTAWNPAENKRDSLSWYSWTSRGAIPKPAEKPKHGEGDGHEHSEGDGHDHGAAGH
jgi:cytochrome c oxidase subunit 2